MTIRRPMTLTATLVLASIVAGAGSADAASAPKPYYSHTHCAGYLRVGKTSVHQSTCVTSSISRKTVTAREWVRIKNTGKSTVTVTGKCTVELWNRSSGKHRALKKHGAGSYRAKTVVKAGQTVTVQPTLCQTSRAVPTSKNAYVDYHVSGTNSVHVAGRSKGTSATETLGSYSGNGFFEGAAGTGGCPAKYSPTFTRGKDNQYCVSVV